MRAVTFRKTAITVIIVATILWFYNFNQSNKHLKELYKRSSFKGVIKDTIHHELQHDLPTYIFTNGSSHLSNLSEASMQNIAKAGDSLSKVSGIDTVHVFRKNSQGDYVQLYPADK